LALRGGLVYKGVMKTSPTKTKLVAQKRRTANRATHGLEDLAVAIKEAVALPDRVADFLRGKILSGAWRPGDRIVETRIARELGIGQPTVREALGKLEEGGLVVRFPNSGCVVTQLTKEDYSQIFRVRSELECLAVELAVENRDRRDMRPLKGALAKLLMVAKSGNVEKFYIADLGLHREIWKLADNRFLEKSLAQMVVPLFAFAMIEIIAHPEFDLRRNSEEHERLIEAILTSSKGEAVRIAKQVMGEFWREGLTLVDSQIKPASASTESNKPKRSKLKIS
jgi:DNA-binding GntR family transcriptional regulator